SRGSDCCGSASGVLLWPDSASKRHFTTGAAASAPKPPFSMMAPAVYWGVSAARMGPEPTKSGGSVAASPLPDRAGAGLAAGREGVEVVVLEGRGGGAEGKAALLSDADEAGGEGVPPRLLELDVIGDLFADQLEGLGLGHVDDSGRLARGAGGDHGQTNVGNEVVAAVGEGRVAVHQLQRGGGEQAATDGELQVVADEGALTVGFRDGVLLGP